MRYKEINIFQLMKDQGNLTKVWIYSGYETTNDPYDHTKDITYNNPIAIKAFVTDQDFSSLKWKYYGQIPYESKKIVCEKKYENLLKLARKIKIGEDNFIVYKDASKGFVMKKEDVYIIAVLEKVIL